MDYWVISGNREELVESILQRSSEEEGGIDIGPIVFYDPYDAGRARTVLASHGQCVADRLRKAGFSWRTEDGLTDDLGDWFTE